MFVLGLMLACPATNAQAPDPGGNEAGLAMQVTKTENDVKTSSALIRDAALNSYVRGVACRVAGLPNCSTSWVVSQFSRASRESAFLNRP